MVCIRLPADGGGYAAGRRETDGKMISWAAVAEAIAAFSKGVLFALELFAGWHESEK